MVGEKFENDILSISNIFSPLFTCHGKIIMSSNLNSRLYQIRTLLLLDRVMLHLMYTFKYTRSVSLLLG